MPKAYWIAQYSQVHDPAKLAAYAVLAGPAIEAAGGRFLARGDAAYAFESGKIPAHCRDRIPERRCRGVMPTRAPHIKKPSQLSTAE